ncbi:MAG: two-component regulator propeller domain-containing protein [Bacteroidota bacterium]
MNYSLSIAGLMMVGLLLSCNGQAKLTAEQADLEVASQITIGDTVAAIGNSAMIIFQDSRSNYWFGSNGQGAFRYDGKVVTQLTTKHGLCANQIWGIQEDQEGNIYFDTGKGVSKLTDSTLTCLPLIENYLFNNQWQLNPNDLWFKGGPKGPYRYDGQALYAVDFPGHFMKEEFDAETPNASWSPYDIYHIYKDKRGHLWFGTANLGLCRYDGTTLSWMYEHQLTITDEGGSFGIRSIMEDQHGDFWICNTRYRYTFAEQDSLSNGHRFLQYDRKAGMTWLKGKKPEDHPYYLSITEDKEGNLWMVTYDDGVYYYDGELLHHHPVEKDGKTVLLFSIYLDHQGDLWLGTHKAGPFRFNGERFVPFRP